MRHEASKNVMQNTQSTSYLVPRCTNLDLPENSEIGVCAIEKKNKLRSLHDGEGSVQRQSVQRQTGLYRQTRRSIAAHVD